MRQCLIASDSAGCDRRCGVDVHDRWSSGSHDFAEACVAQPQLGGGTRSRRSVSDPRAGPDDPWGRGSPIRAPLSEPQLLSLCTPGIGC
jgi:hypothetical protein